MISHFVCSDSSLRRYRSLSYFRVPYVHSRSSADIDSHNSADFVVCFLTLPFVKLQNGVEEWRIMFWISAVVFTSATVLFWLFGSGEIQPWNDSTHTKVPTISDEERRINETTTKDMVAEETEENERL